MSTTRYTPAFSRIIRGNIPAQPETGVLYISSFGNSHIQVQGITKDFSNNGQNSKFQKQLSLDELAAMLAHMKKQHDQPFDCKESANGNNAEFYLTELEKLPVPADRVAHLFQVQLPDESTRNAFLTSSLANSAKRFEYNMMIPYSQEEEKSYNLFDISRHLRSGDNGESSGSISVNGQSVTLKGEQKDMDEQTWRNYFTDYPAALKEYILREFNQNGLLALPYQTIKNRANLATNEQILLKEGTIHYDFILNDDNSVTLITNLEVFPIKTQNMTTLPPAALFQTVTVIKWDSTTKTLQHDLVSDKGVLLTSDKEITKCFQNNNTLGKQDLIDDYANHEIDPVTRSLQEAQQEFKAERDFYLNNRINPLDYTAQRNWLKTAPYRETEKIIKSMDTLAENSLDKKTLARSLLATNLYVATNGSRTAKHSLIQAMHEHSDLAKKSDKQHNTILSSGYLAAAWALRALSKLVMTVSKTAGEDLANTSSRLRQTGLSLFDSSAMHYDTARKITYVPMTTPKRTEPEDEPIISDVDLEAVQSSRIAP